MKFVCPNCQQRFDAPEHWAGRTIRCTRCEEPVVVPSTSEDTAAPPAETSPASPASKAATPPSSPEAAKPLPDVVPTPLPRDATSPLPRDVVPTLSRETSPPPPPSPDPVTPPLRKSPLPPTDAAPLPPLRPTGTPDFVKVAFYILLLAAGIFEYTAFKNEESPQKTWRRFANFFGGSPEPSPIPAPSPTATPAPTAAPAQKSAATPVFKPTVSPTATPPPALDLVAWLMAHRNRWPKEVTLLQPQDFPAVFEGKVVGAVSLPAGTVVTLVEVAPREIGVVSPGGSGKKLPPEATNLFELAQAEMQRPEPTPPPVMTAAPTPTPVLTPTPTPTVISTPTPTPTPSSKPTKSYFGEPVDTNDNSDPNPAGPPADHTLTSTPPHPA